MGRPTLLANLSHYPIQGSCWIIKNISTGEIAKCSITTPKDAPNHLIKLSHHIFTVRLGSKRTSLIYLKFNPNSLMDSSNTWLWLNLSQLQADAKGLLYSEPNKIDYLFTHITIPNSNFIKLT